LSADLSLRDVLEVQAHFDLPSPALVEKDYHITRALAAIASIDTEPFGLVFGGGTSLCRAHRLIRRLSEDIDLKIICDHEPARPELRRLRDRVTVALLAAGFHFDPNNRADRDSRNENMMPLFSAISFQATATIPWPRHEWPFPLSKPIQITPGATKTFSATWSMVMPSTSRPVFAR
jgi:hypothetical protein